MSAKITSSRPQPKREHFDGLGKPISASEHRRNIAIGLSAFIGTLAAVGLLQGEANKQTGLSRSTSRTEQISGPHTRTREVFTAQDASPRAFQADPKRLVAINTGRGVDDLVEAANPTLQDPNVPGARHEEAALEAYVQQEMPQLNSEVKGYPYQTAQPDVLYPIPVAEPDHVPITPKK